MVVEDYAGLDYGGRGLWWLRLLWYETMVAQVIVIWGYGGLDYCGMGNMMAQVIVVWDYSGLDYDGRGLQWLDYSGRGLWWLRLWWYGTMVAWAMVVEDYGGFDYGGFDYGGFLDNLEWSKEPFSSLDSSSVRTITGFLTQLCYGPLDTVT